MAFQYNFLLIHFFLTGCQVNKLQAAIAIFEVTMACELIYDSFVIVPPQKPILKHKVMYSFASLQFYKVWQKNKISASKGP